MSVELKNISKSFGNVVVLNNVNLKIEKGEFFVILGPSGTGKSTLLRIIAGLEEPDEGLVLIDDVVVNDMDPSKRNIAMVFQNYALYPHMTVFNNIAFPLKMRNAPKEEIIKRVNEVANLLNISHLLNKYPYQLSGGEQQRVALARALVRNPKVFLLDEPLSNLDAKLRVKLRFELRRLLHDQLGVTCVYVTHDQIEAMTMADRIALMNRGIIEQVGVPTELYTKPKNLFVASFIGSPAMNFIVAQVLENEIKIGNYKIESREKLSIASDKVILGIRPQHLAISSEGISAELIGIERLGSGHILHALLNDQEISIYTEEDLPKDIVQLNIKVIHIKPKGPLYLFDYSNEELITSIREYSLTLS